ncbi:hypothetical protein [Methylobacterium sp. V23]|uniref:hypothetical protein n=1 Tax=Methylobacterium sp. V23 TaxID=2044878 RepID=UPI000CDA6A1B|nr:hypothetical protein [Methylobacterium sp. V23]POR40192.1 hypothetical protein CRT23_25265 [Methylobacterium sp. V23]
MTILQGKVVAISVSDAPDRAKLGYPAREIERTVFTLCAVLIRAGATIQYAGDLRPDGWTFKLFRHLAGAYAGRSMTPFVHVVPEPVVRRTSFETFRAGLAESRGTADTVFVVGGRMRRVYPDTGTLIVDPGAGQVVLGDDASLSDWLAGFPTAPAPQAFSEARRIATTAAVGRVSLGGKMGLLDVTADRYEGVMPGIADEAIVTLQAGKAYVPLAAYGGSTRDVAIALGLLDASERVPRGPQADTYDPAMDVVAGLTEQIPNHVRARLRSIASDDRTEHAALCAVEVIAAWTESPAADATGNVEPKPSKAGGSASKHRRPSR